MWFRVAEGICLPCRQLRNGFVEWVGKVAIFVSVLLKSFYHVCTKTFGYVSIWLITVTYVKLHKKPFTLIYVWLMWIDETLKSAIEKYHNRTALIDQGRDFPVNSREKLHVPGSKSVIFLFHTNYMQVLCLVKKKLS